MHEIVHHRLCRGGGQCEADTDRLAGGRKDRRIDPDDAARHVEKRPAGIPLVDRGIGLNEIRETARVDCTVKRGHDPRRHAAAETERIADRHHPVADPERIGIAEADIGKRVRRIHLEHGQVRCLVMPDQLRVAHLAIGEDDGNFLRPVDHMIVGDDHARRIDDEARAERRRGGAAFFAVIVKEFPQGGIFRQVLEFLRNLLLLLRRDIHHGGRQCLREIGKTKIAARGLRGSGNRQKRQQQKPGGKKDNVPGRSPIVPVRSNPRCRLSNRKHILRQLPLRPFKRKISMGALPPRNFAPGTTTHRHVLPATGC